METANTANISDLADLFEVLDIPFIDLGSFGIDFRTYASPIARLTATLLYIATPTIVTYYISGRIVIMCFLWLAGFVMQKIGRAIPPASGSSGITIIQGGIQTGNALPSLGPRVLRGGGRRRRSRW